jgi:hypothetical protein
VVPGVIQSLYYTTRGPYSGFPLLVGGWAELRFRLDETGNPVSVCRDVSRWVRCVLVFLISEIGLD